MFGAVRLGADLEGEPRAACLRHCVALALLLVLCGMLWGASPALGTEGETLRYAGGGQGPVVFDGAGHAARGFVCKDCHTALFATRQEARISLKTHFQGRSCFFCHNNVSVSRQCALCHRKFVGESRSVYESEALSPQSRLHGPPLARTTRKQLQNPLNYEGVSSIGGLIMPEAVRLFSARTEVPFSGVTLNDSGTALLTVARADVSMGGMDSHPNELQKKQIAAWQVIGYHALGIYVHPGNPVKNLDSESLLRIFSGAVNNWRALGGPDLPITVYADKEKTVYDSLRMLRRLVMGAVPLGDLNYLDSTLECLEAVGQDMGGITAAPVAYADAQASLVHINGVYPHWQAVVQEKYALQFPLVLVTLQPTGHIQEFFEFILSPTGQAVVAKHFIPLQKNLLKDGL